MLTRTALRLALCTALAPAFAAAQAPDPKSALKLKLERGTIRADPAFRIDAAGADAKLAGLLKRFDKLEADFDWEMEPAVPAGITYTVRRLRFPSPIEGPHPDVNTVLADFYAPVGEGRRQAVIVLDIMEGRGRVSSLVAGYLASQGLCALAVQAPYRGERRPKDKNFTKEMLFDPKLITRGSEQAISEVGRAAVWLRRRPEVDPKLVHLCGVSLGGFTAGAAAGVYRGFPRTVMVIAGGDVATVLLDGRGERGVEEGVKRSGLTREQITEMCAPFDPLTYASRIPAGSLLMINGEKDTVVPADCARKLAAAVSKTEQVWLPCTHHGVVFFLPHALKRTADHLLGRQPEAGPAGQR